MTRYRFLRWWRARWLLVGAVAALSGLAVAAVGSSATSTRAPSPTSSLSAAAPWEEAVHEDLPRIRPTLRRTRRLLEDLRPGLRALRQATPGIDVGLRRGTAVARRLPPENDRLQSTLDATRWLTEDPVLPKSLNRQLHALQLTRPVLDPLVPAQVERRQITRAATGAAAALSEGNAFGTWARTLLLLDPQGTTGGGD